MFKISCRLNKWTKKLTKKKKKKKKKISFKGEF